MSSAAKASRSRVVERRRAEKRRKRIAYGVIALGLVLLIAAVTALVGPGSGSSGTGADFNYAPEDVVRGEAFVAVHEMGAGPPIPFLPASGPQPSIATSEDFIDVGSVGPNEVVRLEFAIANTGQAPLTISRAFTTCGCTTAEISSTVIPPGKVAEVELVFDAGFHDTRGQVVRRGLIIENNDPKHSTQEIWIQASVRSN